MTKWALPIGSGLVALLLTAVAVPPADALTNLSEWSRVIGAPGLADWLLRLIPPEAPSSTAESPGVEPPAVLAMAFGNENLSGWGHVLAVAFQNTTLRFGALGAGVLVIALAGLAMMRRRSA